MNDSIKRHVEEIEAVADEIVRVAGWQRTLADMADAIDAHPDYEGEDDVASDGQGSHVLWGLVGDGEWAAAEVAFFRFKTAVHAARVAGAELLVRLAAVLPPAPADSEAEAGD